MWEVLLTLSIIVASAWLLGRYMAVALGDATSPIDRFFAPIENVFYRVIGVNANQGMGWKGIAKAFIVSNIVLAVIVQAIFMFQQFLPLNPDHIPGMSWDLALHTMISFLTNTNQQHYSGQAQLSYFSRAFHFRCSQNSGADRCGSKGERTSHSSWPCRPDGRHQAAGDQWRWLVWTKQHGALRKPYPVEQSA